jgi:ABC-type metal ion transport system substrate-binding protein
MPIYPARVGRRVVLAGAVSPLLVRRAAAATTLRIGVLSGPQAELMRQAAELAKPRGLLIQLVESNDAATLLRALRHGTLDATASHTAQQLDHTGLMPAFPTITLPIGLYSKRIRSIALLRDGDAVMLPSTTMENARARVLMYNVGLLFAHEDDGLSADFSSIVNPRHFTLQSADPSKLASRLADAAAVLLPYENAVAAGLNPGTDPLALEDGKSPYAQVVAVRQPDLGKAWLASLARVFQSRTMRRFIYERYGDSVQPPW